MLLHRANIGVWAEENVLELRLLLVHLLDRFLSVGVCGCDAIGGVVHGAGLKRELLHGGHGVCKRDTEIVSRRVKGERRNEALARFIMKGIWESGDFKIQILNSNEDKDIRG